jgi:CDP-diacylglycerol--glycerol-3-phosphate 3-phosphatidyltransferase
VKAANVITLVRIMLIPVFIAAYVLEIPYHMYIALAVFILASATDKLDGYVARKYDQVSNFGKFIDPLADKLLICTALLLLVESGIVPAVAAIIIIAREFIVTSLRTVAMSAGRVVAAGFSGKVKMVVQVVCICILLIPLRETALFGALTVGGGSVWLMVICTLWSGIEYCVQNRDIITDTV